MAIAGRVAIVPKGEYSNAVTYDKLDLVMFNNDAYIAKKASTGIEPTNDEYWMLILNNVVAEDLEKIINGTTPVGNANDADKLDGFHASAFVQNLVVSSENKTDDPNTTEKSRIRTIHANCPTANVEYIIDTTFTDSTANTYERRQTAYGTGGNNVVYNRAKVYGGAWTAWKKNANADEVLPLDGSKAITGSTLQISNGYASVNADANHINLAATPVKGDYSSHRAVRILNSAFESDSKNALEFYEMVNGVGSAKKLLHTGNMKDYVLPLDGSVPMSGYFLYLFNKYGAIYTDTNKTTVNSYNSNTDLTNARCLMVLNSNQVADVGNAIVARDVVNGTPTDYTVLHTGNSQKVVTSASAPSDTSALWVDTTNKKVKAYIDGAWTAMA